MNELHDALLRYLEGHFETDTWTFRQGDRLQIGLDLMPLTEVLAALADDAAVVPAWVCNEIGEIYGLTYGELSRWLAARLA